MEFFEKKLPENLPSCIKENFARFYLLLLDKKTTAVERRLELEKCPVLFIKCLVICATNILYGNFNPSKQQIAAIKRYRRLFYILESSAYNLKEKRKRLVSYAAVLPKIFDSLVVLVKQACDGRC